MMGTLYAFPFLALEIGMYQTFLSHRASQVKDHSAAEVLIVLAMAAVSLVLHEALHGVGWAAAGGLGWKGIALGRKGLLPSCYCPAALPAGQYQAGVLLPFLVLGGGSMVLLLICPGMGTVLLAFVNLYLSGEDLAVAFAALRSGAPLFAGIREGVGFVAISSVKKSSRMSAFTIEE